MNRFAIYAADGTLMRWIVSDTLTIDKCGLAKGETALVIPDQVYGDKLAIQAFVAQQTGLVAPPEAKNVEVVPAPDAAALAARQAKIDAQAVKG